MKYIPYVISVIIIAWAVYSLVKYFTRKKRGYGGSCGGCPYADSCSDLKKDGGEKIDK